MKRLMAAVFILALGTCAIPLSGDAAATAAVSRPALRDVRYRLHDQTLRVREGVKSGKFTVSQVKSLNRVLRKVRSRLNADLKQNGNGSLTAGQEKELNQLLDGTSMTIYGDIR